jgi:ABC-type sugar transport system, periplasmic component
MKSWKTKAWTVTLATASILLAACGGGKPEEARTNEDGDIIMTVGQQTAPNSKLPKGDSYSDNAYRRVIKDKLGVELESAFEANGEDYDRQVSLAIASGDIPDMMVVTRDELQELVDNDLVEDLTDVYDKYASDRVKEIYDSYDGFTLGVATIDDKLMAIPGTTNDFGPNMVWIRQDWADQLNIKLDKDGNHAITLEELESTAKAFKEQDPGKTGKTQGLALANWLTSADHGGSGYTATAIANAFGAYPKVYLQDDDGKVYYGSNTKEMKESLAYMHKLFKEGLLDPQFGTRTYDDINAMMVNGELGVIPGPWHMSDWGLVQAKTTNPDAQFVPYAIEDEDGSGRINAVNKPATGVFV